MFLMRFTERAYTNYTEEAVRNSPNQAVRLTFSNSNFDPVVGSRQYNEYLDEYEYCEEVGFDGLMLNEHHNTPTCLGATMNLEAAILARNTKTPKIVLLGNPLPVFDNPLRLAEELAEIDMISGRAAGVWLRARHRRREPGSQRQPAVQQGAVRGSPRPPHQNLDHPRTLPLGGQALPLPGGQPLRATHPATAPARLDPPAWAVRRRWYGPPSAVIPTSISRPTLRAPRT